MRNIVVLGGGISGLSSAYYLLKYSNAKVTLIEATRLGGWIKSIKYKNLILEMGPRTIRCTGKSALNALELMNDLPSIHSDIVGLSSQEERFSNRYVFYKKHLHKLPNNIMGLIIANSLTNSPLLKYIFKEMSNYNATFQNDVSIYEFGSKLFGQEVAEMLLDPLIKGIYGGDIKKLSVKSCLPVLYEHKEKYKSICLGMLLNSVFTPKTKL